MKYVSLIIAFLICFSNSIFAQGYFGWPWPNQGVPDSIYSYQIDDMNEVIDIRQYFVKNSSGKIIFDSSFMYFPFSMKWWYGDKVESIFDNDGNLLVKKDYVGELSKWNYQGIDSIFVDQDNPQLYHITTYVVDEMGNTIFPVFYQMYFLDMDGRDSLIFGFSENMELNYKIETKSYPNIISSNTFYFSNGQLELVEVDSIVTYSDFYIYQYQASIDGGPLELQVIDTIFLDQKGRLDVGKLYSNDGEGNFNYVYKQKFYFNELVSNENREMNKLNECDVAYTSPYLIIENCDACDLTIYNFEGVKVFDFQNAPQQVNLNGRLPSFSPYILQLRNASGNICIKKFINY